MKTLDPLILITPVMLLLAVGIIVFVVLYQRRMLQHQEQVRQLQSAKQQQVLEATLHAQEEERRRVARDLHDEVGAMLALIRLNLHQMVSNTECEDEKLQENARCMKQQLDEVLNSVRRISHDLMPVVLEKMGLAQALEALRKTLASSSGKINLVISCNDKANRLKPQHELLLYRMVQELLNNTLKHAQASQVSIDLQYTPSETLLVYKDDGIGFDTTAMQHETVINAGLGIMSLQSRAVLLNGSINITSTPGAGTTARICIPTTSPEITHTTYKT